jgi:hypothetical protein
VERVNGYIETISLQNKPSKHNPRAALNAHPKKPSKTASRNSSVERAGSLSKQLKAEREINKNLQKCIIEIQKILW